MTGPASAVERQLGYAAIAVYCVSTAASAVWVTFAFSRISGAALSFFTLLVAWAVFATARALRGGNPFALSGRHPLPVAWLNVLTVASWWFMFMALQRIEASVESAIYQGWLPIAVLLCEIVAGTGRVFSLRAAGPALIAVSVFGLVWARVKYGGVVQPDPAVLREGLVLATVAGFAGGLYVYWSGRLAKASGCSTLDILANRFFLLLVLTGALGVGEVVRIAQLEFDLLVRLLLLSLVSVVIPVYTLQHAIVGIGSARVSIITPSVPAIALGLEFVIAPWGSLWVPAFVVAVCVSVLLANYWMQRPQPVATPASLHLLPPTGDPP